jgi:hypothetical protein
VNGNENHCLLLDCCLVNVLANIVSVKLELPTAMDLSALKLMVFLDILLSNNNADDTWKKDVDTEMKNVLCDS